MYARLSRTRNEIAMRKRFCLFLLFILALTGFRLYGALKDDIQISLEEKQIQNLSPSGLNLVFYINITNSSSKTYYFTAYDYRFVVNQVPYIRLETPLDTGMMIEASKNTLIAIPVKITYDLLFQNISEIEDADKVPCYISGGLTFFEGRRKRGNLPFAFSAEFPIYREIEIEFVGINVKMLTIGGTDSGFEVMFKNGNGFDFFIDRIAYSLKLGGHLISEGNIGGDKTIEKHGEKIFTISLLLNFFDVGKDVYSFLQQSSASCQFSGEIEIRNIWGRIKTPFDIRENIAIIRSP